MEVSTQAMQNGQQRRVRPSTRSTRTVNTATNVQSTSGAPAVRRTGTRQPSTEVSNRAVGKTAGSSRPQPNRISKGPLGTGEVEVRARVRQSTRRTTGTRKPIDTDSTHQSAYKNKFTQFLFTSIIRKPEPKVTPHSDQEDYEEMPSRTEVYGGRREVKRTLAPVRFIFAVFVAVCISVFAFGLLRDTPDTNDKASTSTGNTYLEKEGGTTSTNTGILRGQ